MATYGLDVEKEGVALFKTQNKKSDQKSDTFIMPTDDPRADLDIDTIVLIGAPGSGKSSLGNVFTMSSELPK